MNALRPRSRSADPAADIRATFSWSYRQLDGDAARTFRLVGLHPGIDLEPRAVAALTGMTPELAGRALDALARASMIQAVGHERYTMNCLLRAYALEQAIQHLEKESQAALTASSEHYLQAASTMVPH